MPYQLTVITNEIKKQKVEAMNVKLDIEAFIVYWFRLKMVFEDLLSDVWVYLNMRYRVSVSLNNYDEHN